MKNTFFGRWAFFALVAILGFFADWFTKYLVVSQMIPYKPIHIIGEYFQFMLVYNKAALFGLDPRHLIPWFPLNGFFTVFAFIVMGALVLYYKSLNKADRLMHWAIALIMAGAFGNLYDRMFFAHRGVVDFIRIGISPQIYCQYLIWPIFMLVLVLVLLFFVLFVMRKRQQQSLRQKKLNSNKCIQGRIKRNSLHFKYKLLMLDCGLMPFWHRNFLNSPEHTSRRS